MISPDTPRDYTQSADRFYALVAGRSDTPVIIENEHAVAFDDGSDEETTRISIITREAISSLESLDFADALRWMAMLDLLRKLPAAMGWGPGDGFRVDMPVHPPYQHEAWLRLHVLRRSSKALKPGADEHGYTRDIGHFAEVAALRRHVDLVFVSDEFLVFHNPEDDDSEKFDHVMMGIPRRHVRTILDEDFTMQDWLALASGLRQAAREAGLDAYTVYFNVGPPYQHTPWVHVHLLAGGNALKPHWHEGHAHGEPEA